MLKIVIAEDMGLEREGLVRSIPWDELGIAVAGAAEDGLEAWELIRLHKPDIVLTDIKMPIWDGIELAKQIAASYPSTKIIFISGYEDFNFALEAIKTKVCEYVLKPYTLQEITAALRKVADLCRLENEKRREEQLIKTRLEETKPVLKEKLLKDIVRGAIAEEHVLQEMLRFLNIEAAFPFFSLMLLELENASEPDQLEPASIGDWIPNLHSGIDCMAVFTIREGEYLILLNQSESMLRNNHLLDALGREIRAVFKANFYKDIALCVSRPVAHLLDIAKCYREVREALKFAPLFGKDDIIYYDQLNDADTFSRANKIVNSVKQLISAKYMETITIADIAGELYMSPNYLNSIFKKSTGKSMNKYLIEVRISAAMELLAEADAVIGRISERVGYKNVAHFSTLFKKHTGLTPMEYRENTARMRKEK